MDKEIIELLTKVGVSTAGQLLTLIVLGFFGKQIIQYFLSSTVELKKTELGKELESHKQALSAQTELYKLDLTKVLETHKSDLALLNAKSSKLHDVRLQIIAKLYQKVSILEKCFKEMTARIRIVQGDSGQEELNRITKAGEAFNDFSDYYNENRIFFSEETCSSLDKLREHLWNAHWDYTFKQRMGVDDIKMNREYFDKAATVVEKDLPIVLKQLDKNFRQLLTVE